MDINKREYDIVIIGSGAGGGTVAKELAPLCRTGARIAVLEWGGHFRNSDNTRRENEMVEKYYVESGGFQTTTQDLSLAFARAVGGSTKVYTGTSLTMDQALIERWQVSDITLEDLTPRYEKYKSENNVHFKQEQEMNDNDTLFRDACNTLGWKVSQFPVNTQNCLGLGTCNLGCANGSKMGTAEVQLPMASNQGVEIIPFCEVDKIEGNHVLATVHPPSHGLQPSQMTPGKYRIKSERIVLSAGSIYSSAILLRSFGEQLSPALGRYFTCHPALILSAVQDRPISNTVGHPKSFFCDEFQESGSFILETCMYFPFVLAKSIVGFGAELDRFMSSYEHMQMILALIIDDAEAHNRVFIDRAGRPKVAYRFSQKSLQAFVQSCRESARIFFASGAKKVHVPATKHMLLDVSDKDNIDALVRLENFKLGKASISAAHLMGGCRMGDDPSTSVTDPWGRIHGLQNVYVADASLFPKCSVINPYLTVMALADRVAEGIRKEVGASG